MEKIITEIGLNKANKWEIHFSSDKHEIFMTYVLHFILLKVSIKFSNHVTLA
jgi:hypothetical protein